MYGFGGLGDLFGTLPAGDPLDRVMAQTRAELPDPVACFHLLSDVQTALQRAADRTGVERARICAELHAEGLSYAEIGRRLDLTRARVHQLVERANK